MLEKIEAEPGVVVRGHASRHGAIIGRGRRLKVSRHHSPQLRVDIEAVASNRRCSRPRKRARRAGAPRPNRRTPNAPASASAAAASASSSIGFTSHARLGRRGAGRWTSPRSRIGRGGASGNGTSRPRRSPSGRARIWAVSMPVLRIQPKGPSAREAHRLEAGLDDREPGGRLAAHRRDLLDRDGRRRSSRSAAGGRAPARPGSPTRSPRTRRLRPRAPRSGRRARRGEHAEHRDEPRSACAAASAASAPAAPGGSARPPGRCRQTSLRPVLQRAHAQLVGQEARDGRLRRLPRRRRVERIERPPAKCASPAPRAAGPDPTRASRAWATGRACWHTHPGRGRRVRPPAPRARSPVAEVGPPRGLSPGSSPRGSRRSSTERAVVERPQNAQAPARPRQRSTRACSPRGERAAARPTSTNDAEARARDDRRLGAPLGPLAGPSVAAPPGEAWDRALAPTARAPGAAPRSALVPPTLRRASAPPPRERRLTRGLQPTTTSVSKPARFSCFWRAGAADADGLEPPREAAMRRSTVSICCRRSSTCETSLTRRGRDRRRAWRRSRAQDPQRGSVSSASEGDQSVVVVAAQDPLLVPQEAHHLFARVGAVEHGGRQADDAPVDHPHGKVFDAVSGPGGRLEASVSPWWGPPWAGEEAPAGSLEVFPFRSFARAAAGRRGTSLLPSRPLTCSERVWLFGFRRQTYQ